MTPTEHDKQRERVAAAMLLAPTTAERHAIYPVRPNPTTPPRRAS